MTVTAITDSGNTTQGTSTTTSVNSITDVTSTTGEESEGIFGGVFHCSRYDGYQGSMGEVFFYISVAGGSLDSKSDVYIDAISTIQIIPVNFNHIQMLR